MSFKIRTAEFNTMKLNDLAGSLAQAISANGATGIIFNNLNINNGNVNGTLMINGQLQFTTGNNITAIGPPMYNLRNALLNTSSGNSDTYIACLGDSTTVGFLANTQALGFSGAFQFSWPFLVSNMFSNAGYKSNIDAIIGDKNIGLSFVDYGQYDNRVSAPGWPPGNSNNGVGGNYFQTTTTGSFNYTPTNPFNVLDVIYLTTPTATTVNVLVNNSLVGNFNCVGSSAMHRLTITGLNLQVQPISLQPTSTTGAYFMGLIPRNTNQTQIYFHVIAGAGAVAGQWLQANYGLPSFVSTGVGNYPYSTTVLSFGTNEVVNFPGQFANYMTGMLGKAFLMATGNPANDVMMLTEPHIQVLNAGALPDLQYQLFQQMYSMASNQWPVADPANIAGSYQQSVNEGYIPVGEGYHWSRSGYNLAAKTVFFRMNQSIQSATINSAFL